MSKTKIDEATFEASVIELLEQQGIPYVPASAVNRNGLEEVLIEDDLRAYLRLQYQEAQLTEVEINGIIRQLKGYTAADLYESNKAIMKLLVDGLNLKREDRSQKDCHIYLIDYTGLSAQQAAKPQHIAQVVAAGKENYGKDMNSYKFVTQLEIVGKENKRIPDGILYINGLPLVVFEFKSPIREEVDVYEAYQQLTVRYRRDIPQLFVYNAFCIISDGANTRAGSFFAAYDYFYAWRRIVGMKKEVDGISSLFTLIKGMFDKKRLRDIIRNFIFLPDTSNKEEKILCRYPQYYAANKLYQNIVAHHKPKGDGKGGTYFGATGCGKSITMLFLCRLLMKSVYFASPTIIIITDRTDLDEQLSKQFVKAKAYIGDEHIKSVTSRANLRKELRGRTSGGVLLTTIHKFTEDAKLLSERNNIICISDEAHRSQTNLQQKVRHVAGKGLVKTYGFAKYLHDSLPNATFVGFTGTPVDATLSVFGDVVDAYTMIESVRDDITVRIVYEGRAAKVNLKSGALQKIEDYYQEAVALGANTEQVEKSKQAMSKMEVILGHPDRLKVVAADFVQHYENRVNEGATVRGKAMFVSSNRAIAYAFYKELIALRPEWAEVKVALTEEELTEAERKKRKPMPMLQLVMTRGKGDEEELSKMLGTKEDRKSYAEAFKEETSNFKIAIVVDMWLTGFDVPFLDTIYIDKPIRMHNLVQTISRVNRTFEGKEKGLVVDYIGIKNEMNRALKEYGGGQESPFEGIEQSIIVLKDQLDVLAKLFHPFDTRPYFEGSPLKRLECVNDAVEFVMQSEVVVQRFKDLTKRMKAAYDICSGDERISEQERDQVHFYLVIKSIIYKTTAGGAPDTRQMNQTVRQLIEAALESSGVEEVMLLGEEATSKEDLFDPAYLERLKKIKLPHTKIQLLQQLLKRAIGKLKRVNKLRGIDFSKRMEALVQRYNERDGEATSENAADDIANEIYKLVDEIQAEFGVAAEMGMHFEVKAFYDILQATAEKFQFEYPEDKMRFLAEQIKQIVDDKAQYPDWSKRADIKASLRVDLVMLLHAHAYPPDGFDKVYADVFEQAEHFKQHRVG